MISSLVASGLLVASTASAAAAPAGIADSRAASPVAGVEQGSDTTWLWIGGGVVLLIVLILLLDDGNNNDNLPHSP